jgi:hypothetical protein
MTWSWTAERSWFLGWLGLLCLAVVVNEALPPVSLDDQWDWQHVLLIIVTGLVTVALGFVLGGRGRLGLLLLSPIVGATVMGFFLSMVMRSLGQWEEGDGGYLIIGAAIWCIALALPLWLGALLGFLFSRARKA